MSSMSSTSGMSADGWIEEMRQRLNRSWPERRMLNERDPELPAPREAAVLVPLYVRDKQLFTLFTKRTESVEHHKGQVSFPGGGKEPRDATLWHTATRETEEEIGVPATSVKLLGALPRIITVTNFEVSPFVGAMPYPVAFQAAEQEVEAIVEVPIAYLLNPTVVEEREVSWSGRPVVTKVYHYSGHAIWGATAHILSDFLAVLGGAEPAG